MRKILAVLLCLVLLGGCGAQEPEIYLPEEIEISYDMPLSAYEFIRPNGVFFGMDYSQVKKLCDDDVYEFTCEEGYGSFVHGGVFYGFVADSEGVLRLDSMNIQDAQDSYAYYGRVSDPIFSQREIYLGTTLTEVLDKIPAEDKKLRKRQRQEIYGPNEDGSESHLEFVADSYYALTMRTAEGYIAHLTFSRTKQQLLWVELYNSAEPLDEDAR